MTLTLGELGPHLTTSSPTLQLQLLFGHQARRRVSISCELAMVCFSQSSQCTLLATGNLTTSFARINHRLIFDWAEEDRVLLRRVSCVVCCCLWPLCDPSSKSPCCPSRLRTHRRCHPRSRSNVAHPGHHPWARPGPTGWDPGSFAPFAQANSVQNSRTALFAWPLTAAT